MVLSSFPFLLQGFPPVNINIVRCGSLMMIIFLPKMNTLLPIVAAFKKILGEGSLAVGRVLHSVSPNNRVSVESNRTFPSLIPPPVTIKVCYESL